MVWRGRRGVGYNFRLARRVYAAHAHRGREKQIDTDPGMFFLPHKYIKYSDGEKDFSELSNVCELQSVYLLCEALSESAEEPTHLLTARIIKESRNHVPTGTDI